MHNTAKEQQKLLARIRRIRGQVNSVETRLGSDEMKCAEILQLLAAVRGGINALMAEVLEDHIRFHLVAPGKKEISSEEVAADVIDLVRAYLK
nr:metal-sensitive transcriptional repressor [uncultured bacterium]